MVNNRKTKLFYTELNMLDVQEQSYIEKLVNSLLTVQNAVYPHKHNLFGQNIEVAEQADKSVFALNYEENKS